MIRESRGAINITVGIERDCGCGMCLCVCLYVFMCGVKIFSTLP